VRLVVGLGNPGARYADTRHNVAWQVLDRLAERWRAAPAPGAPVFAARFARVGDLEVELMQPLTYMNRTGEALTTWIERRGGPPEDWLAVADDVWLPIGMVRLKPRGSSGGHKGLASLEAALGSQEFARLRVGVGEAESQERLKEHVLAPFEPDEMTGVQEAIERAADAVACWVTDGVQTAMNRFNRKIVKEVQEP
jgi:peptidyl-tRNA hydrolase, PTH1 family